MSAAYSAIVRSLENFPELATFRMAFSRPCVRIGIQLRKSLVGLKVGRQIRQVHIEVPMGQEHVAQRIEDAGLVPAEVVGEDQIQRRPRLRFVFVVPVRVVPAAAVRPPVPPSGRTGRSSLRPPSSAISMVAPSRVPMVRRRSS